VQRPRVHALFAVPLIVATIVISASPVLGTLGVALSAEQQRRLDGGEVVFLDVLPPGGPAKGSMGGTAVSRVHASPRAVWKVLVDYRGHSGLYPRVTGAQIVEMDGSHSLVRYVVGVGPFSFGFHVNNYPDESGRRLDWRLAADRPNDLFRSSWGYWQIEPAEVGAIVTYAMGAQTVLPSFLTRGAERESMVETVKAVRGRAEQTP
jgi:hypothetical protein